MWSKAIRCVGSLRFLLRTGSRMKDGCVFHGKAATDSIASLPPIPGESCHPSCGCGPPCDAGGTYRYPALFSHREGGADACTEVSHASSPHSVAAQMGPGAER